MASEMAGDRANLTLKHRVQSSHNKGYNGFLQKGTTSSRVAGTPNTWVEVDGRQQAEGRKGLSQLGLRPSCSEGTQTQH